MLLDSQNQFRKYMEMLKKEEEVTLPPGYAELYKQWAKKYENVLYQWSAEEMTERFALFVDESMQNQVLALIEEGGYSETQQRITKQLLARRQLILVSRNGGVTFDHIITAANLKEGDPMSYNILSPTLHSATNNLQEVLDEQALLYVAKKLGEQQFTLQGAWVDEKHVVHVDVVPRGGIEEVKVDLKEEVTQPLVYQFIKDSGEVEKMVETQMPEKFGQAKPDVTIIDATPEQKGLMLGLDHGASTETDAANAANAAAATMESIDAVNLINKVNAENAENAVEAQENAKRAMAAPLLQAQAADAKLTNVSNVMASKAAVAARSARQAKKMQSERERYEEVRAGRDKELQAKREQIDEKKQTAKARAEKQKKQTKMRAAAGAGFAGLVGGAAAGTTLFINHINIIS